MESGKKIVEYNEYPSLFIVAIYIFSTIIIRNRYLNKIDYYYNNLLFRITFLSKEV